MGRLPSLSWLLSTGSFWFVFVDMPRQPLKKGASPCPPNDSKVPMKMCVWTHIRAPTPQGQRHFPQRSATVPRRNKRHWPSTGHELRRQPRPQLSSDTVMRSGEVQNAGLQSHRIAMRMSTHKPQRRIVCLAAQVGRRIYGTVTQPSTFVSHPSKVR